MRTGTIKYNNSKLVNSTELSPVRIFQAEPLGALNDPAAQFLIDVGKRISAVPRDKRECAFLFRRLSSAVQNPIHSVGQLIFRCCFEFDHLV